MGEPNTKEYDMLRQEILQYLEEYQNVRNMMYIITATILGFGLTNENAVEYVYLLPLVVIIPSFFVYADYRRAIVRAAMYLKVFYEEIKLFPIKWESRLIKFNETQKKLDWQKIPYIVCSYSCIALFFMCMEKSILNFSIAIAVFIVCGIIFIKVKNPKSSDIENIWVKIRNNHISGHDGAGQEGGKEDTEESVCGIIK